MKAKLGNIQMRYFYCGGSGAHLDVIEFSKGDFLGKFLPFYDSLKKKTDFRTTGHSCTYDQHLIGIIIPADCFVSVKKGYEIKNTFSSTGEEYLRKLLDFLTIYGFSELVAFPSAGVISLNQSAESKFDTWLNDNYDYSGEDYYLSKSSTDFQMYEKRKLREQYISLVYTND